LTNSDSRFYRARSRGSDVTVTTRRFRLLLTAQRSVKTAHLYGLTRNTTAQCCGRQSKQLGANALKMMNITLDVVS